MAYPNRASYFLAALTIIGQLFEMPKVASAQAPPQYVVVTTDSLKTWARGLKQDLQDGSLLLADLHAMRLRFALLGVLKEKMSAKVAGIEQLPAPDKGEPRLTAGLVPLVDKLIQELDKSNLGSAKTYSEQLAAQIHSQFERNTRQQIESGQTGDVDYDKYFSASYQLQKSLREGDVAQAAALAVEVQSAEDVLLAKKKRPLVKGNVFYINDALGRAAVLRKDYLAASDYLLKAADIPEGDPALRSFGPDLWLARALLTAGYKDVVLTFLERCKSFWAAPRLGEWISVLQSGGTPDLSRNIYSQEPKLSN